MHVRACTRFVSYMCVFVLARADQGAYVLCMAIDGRIVSSHLRFHKPSSLPPAPSLNKSFLLLLRLLLDPILAIKLVEQHLRPRQRLSGSQLHATVAATPPLANFPWPARRLSVPVVQRQTQAQKVPSGACIAWRACWAVLPALEKWHSLMNRDACEHGRERMRSCSTQHRRIQARTLACTCISWP